MTIEELKSLLSRFHLRPDKRLGQNFLLSEEVLDQIVEAAELSSKDRVLEIGPGLGFLTQRLAERAGEVIAIEKDRKLCLALRTILKRYKNVKIICGDALEITGDPNILMHPNYPNSEHSDGLSRHSDRHKVVANIPYYLTGKILQILMSSTSSAPRLRSGLPSPGLGRVRERWKPALIVLLLQKEVAERITAEPGEMSLLSVSVQLYADSEIIAAVPKENFYPKPEVDSAIVRITPLSSPLTKGGKRGVRFEVDERKFFQLVKIGFSNKRKQLHNNLAALPMSFSGLTRESRNQSEKLWIPDQVGNDRKVDYKLLLSSLGLNPLARAQDLSLEDWRRLYQKIFPSLDGRG